MCHSWPEITPPAGSGRYPTFETGTAVRVPIYAVSHCPPGSGGIEDRARTGHILYMWDILLLKGIGAAGEIRGPEGQGVL
jgi:hypothetical protein